MHFCAFDLEDDEASVSDEQIRIIMEYADTVVLALDNDKPGIKETRRLVRRLGRVMSTFVFNYDRVEWETGDVSGGTNGLGGKSPPATPRSCGTRRSGRATTCGRGSWTGAASCPRLCRGRRAKTQVN